MIRKGKKSKRHYAFLLVIARNEAIFLLLGKIASFLAMTNKSKMPRAQHDKSYPGNLDAGTFNIPVGLTICQLLKSWLDSIPIPLRICVFVRMRTESEV